MFQLRLVKKGQSFTNPQVLRTASSRRARRSESLKDGFCKRLTRFRSRSPGAHLSYFSSHHHHHHHASRDWVAHCSPAHWLTLTRQETLARSGVCLASSLRSSPPCLPGIYPTLIFIGPAALYIGPRRGGRGGRLLLSSPSRGWQAWEGP